MPYLEGPVQNCAAKRPVYPTSPTVRKYHQNSFFAVDHSSRSYPGSGFFSRHGRYLGETIRKEVISEITFISTTATFHYQINTDPPTEFKKMHLHLLFAIVCPLHNDLSWKRLQKPASYTSGSLILSFWRS